MGYIRGYRGRGEVHEIEQKKLKDDPGECCQLPSIMSRLLFVVSVGDIPTPILRHA